MTDQTTTSSITPAIDELKGLFDATGAYLSSIDLADQLVRLELESEPLAAIAARRGIDHCALGTVAGYMGHRAVDAIFEVICRLDQASASGIMGNTSSKRTLDNDYARVDSIVQKLADKADRCGLVAFNGLEELLERARQDTTTGYDRGAFAMPLHLLTNPSATAWCNETARCIERSIECSTDDLTIRDAVVRLILGEANRCVRCAHVRFRWACSSLRHCADQIGGASRLLDAAEALAIHITVRASLHQALGGHLHT